MKYAYIIVLIPLILIITLSLASHRGTFHQSDGVEKLEQSWFSGKNGAIDIW